MTFAQPTPLMQRSHGVAKVSLALHQTTVRVVDLEQSGSAKVILPQYAAGFGDRPEIVFLNTSGGLTGGDSLSYQITLGDGVRATATTQTAERAYKSQSGAARVRVTAEVGAKGWLDWLPQETILFQSSALHRSTRIDLASDAGCLMVETIVLGRAAMGETVTTLGLQDRREIWRAGHPVIIDPFGLTETCLTGSPALLGGAKAIAAIAFVAPAAQDALARLRDVLDEPEVQSAASGWDGKITLRLMAVDGWPLRKQILRVLAVLRPGQAAPRVWQL